MYYHIYFIVGEDPENNDVIFQSLAQNSAQLLRFSRGNESYNFTKQKNCEGKIVKTIFGATWFYYTKQKNYRISINNQNNCEKKIGAQVLIGPRTVGF